MYAVIGATVPFNAVDVLDKNEYVLHYSRIPNYSFFEFGCVVLPSLHICSARIRNRCPVAQPDESR